MGHVVGKGIVRHLVSAPWSLGVSWEDSGVGDDSAAGGWNPWLCEGSLGLVRHAGCQLEAEAGNADGLLTRT